MNLNILKQILDIRMAIGNLNSTISKMTTLVALIFIEKFIIGEYFTIKLAFKKEENWSK